MRFSLRTLVIGALLGAAGLMVGTALAQDSNTSSIGTALVAPVSPIDTVQAASELADRWAATAEARGYDVDGWRSELVANLQRLSPDRVAQAAQADSYGEMVAAVTGKNPDEALSFNVADAVPQALGDKGINLSFIPINPCRVLDTRIAAAEYLGARTSGSTTTISTNVTSRVALQGGNPAGCPLPAADAGAVAYNVTVVDYTGNAFVTVFPYSATRPNASTVNMGPGTAPSPLANSSIVQQCVNCGANTDISIYVEGASTNVIIDIVGYFDPPAAPYFAGSESNGTVTSGIGTVYNAVGVNIGAATRCLVTVSPIVDASATALSTGFPYAFPTWRVNGTVVNHEFGPWCFLAAPASSGSYYSCTTAGVALPTGSATNSYDFGCSYQLGAYTGLVYCHATVICP
jgi:hypothetical protein